ncbi:MAG TPA: hypothetical protein VMR54_01350 [Thermoanaerobaculia bacterium]|nr:hypothetical protein [Thermoanaerobaculia bacterium]
MERTVRAGHLTDEELFGLAVPPAGEPEALPAHLLQCLECGRAFQEWKAAVRELGHEDVEPVTSRSPEQWRTAENRTIEALRRARGRRHFRPLPWAIGLAASVLLAVLLLPARQASRPAAVAPPAEPASDRSELSAEDAADDLLLRQVASLSRGEDAADWNVLAPDPAEPSKGRS